MEFLERQGIVKILVLKEIVLILLQIHNPLIYKEIQGGSEIKKRATRNPLNSKGLRFL